MSRLTPAQLSSLVLLHQGPAVNADGVPRAWLGLGFSTPDSPLLVRSLEWEKPHCYLSVGKAKLILFARLPPAASLEGPSDRAGSCLHLHSFISSFVFSYPAFPGRGCPCRPPCQQTAACPVISQACSAVQALRCHLDFGPATALDSPVQSRCRCSPGTLKTEGHWSFLVWW